MKRILPFILVFFLIFTGCGTTRQEQNSVAATTKPVYEFASALLRETDITVSCVVTENISCLHDYTLSVEQMMLLEKADAVLLSGGGLEDFMKDALRGKTVIDASASLTLLESGHGVDPHYWLSPTLAAEAAENIADHLSSLYPQHEELIQANLLSLREKLCDLQNYGEETLGTLSIRKLVTFHDGFSYFAQAMGLSVLASMEEEHGSETTAKDLISVMDLIRVHGIPAVFTEVNGSENAAFVVAEETGAKIFDLDMAMGENDYFAAMKANIDTVREALQ